MTPLYRDRALLLATLAYVLLLAALTAAGYGAAGSHADLTNGRRWRFIPSDRWHAARPTAGRSAEVTT